MRKVGEVGRASVCLLYKGELDFKVHEGSLDKFKEESRSKLHLQQVTSNVKVRLSRRTGQRQGPGDPQRGGFSVIQVRNGRPQLRQQQGS